QVQRGNGFSGGLDQINGVGNAAQVLVEHLLRCGQVDVRLLRAVDAQNEGIIVPRIGLDRGVDAAGAQETAGRGHQILSLRVARRSAACSSNGTCLQKANRSSERVRWAPSG